MKLKSGLAGNQIEASFEFLCLSTPVSEQHWLLRWQDTRWGSRCFLDLNRFDVNLQHTWSMLWNSPSEDSLIEKLSESPFILSLKERQMVMADAVSNVLGVLILSVFFFPNPIPCLLGSSISQDSPLPVSGLGSIDLNQNFAQEDALGPITLEFSFSFANFSVSYLGCSSLDTVKSHVLRTSAWLDGMQF